MKKVLSVILSLIMAVCVLPAGVAFASGQSAISPGQTVTVTIDYSGDQYILTFTPERTGEYRLTSHTDGGAVDPWCFVNDSRGKTIAEGQDSNINGQLNPNFDITLELTAGEEYTIICQTTNITDSVSYTVELTEVNPPKAPDMPSGLKASEITTTSFKLDWEDVAGAAKYIVYDPSTDPATAREVTESEFTVSNLKAGTEYTVRVVAVSAEGLTSLAASIQVTTLAQIDKNLNVVLNYTSYEYTGKPLGPGLKVYDGNGELLTYKEDYTITYNGERIMPGTYSVTVTFIGDYADVEPITKNFTITGRTANVVLNYTSYEYTGAPIGPGLRAYDENGNLLTYKEDYTVKYNGERTFPGEYSVTVTFIGDYIHYVPVTKEYTITPNKVDVKLNYTSYEYTGRPMGPGLRVYDSKGNLLTANEDYTIKYGSGRVLPGTYTVTVTLKGSYYGTIVKEFTITENKVDVKLNYTSYEYTGRPMGPGLTVTDSKGNALTANEDYTVRYNGERIQPGKYSVTVTLKGSYYGTVEKEFTVTENKVNVKLNYTTYKYTGRPMGPGLTVTDSKGNVLTINEDYTVRYNDERIQPGTYTVTVTLIGNYIGSVDAEFKIVP